jgi:hypothetical protein
MSMTGEGGGGVMHTRGAKLKPNFLFIFVLYNTRKSQASVCMFVCVCCVCVCGGARGGLSALVGLLRVVYDGRIVLAVGIGIIRSRRMGVESERETRT